MKETKQYENKGKRGSASFSALVFALAASALLPVHADVAGEPISCTVENRPQGMVLVIQ